MLTIQYADAALKDYYLDAVNNQLNEGVSPFFNAIEKTTRNVFGKEVKLLLTRKSANSVIAAEEFSNLPSSYSNRYYDVTLPLKNLFGMIELSDKVIRASKDSSGALVNVLNAEMEGLVASAKEHFSRMIFGSKYAIIATVLEVDAVDGKILHVNNCKSWFEGMMIDIKRGASDVAMGVEITAVDVDAKTITLKYLMANMFKPGDTVCVSNQYGKELEGLSSIFDYDTLYGYSKAENSFFKPYRHDVSELTEGEIINAIDMLEERTGVKPKMMICSPYMRKKVAEVITETHTVVTGSELSGGYTSIYVNDVPLITDRYCPDDRIYFLNPEDFVLNQLCDWEWLEDEDGKILKQVPGKAAYSATLVKYAELVCTKPYAQGAIVIS